MEHWDNRQKVPVNVTDKLITLLLMLILSKFLCHILTDGDRNDLQCAVDALQNWSNKLLLNWNI